MAESLIQSSARAANPNYGSSIQALNSAGKFFGNIQTRQDELEKERQIRERQVILDKRYQAGEARAQKEFDQKQKTIADKEAYLAQLAQTKGMTTPVNTSFRAKVQSGPDGVFQMPENITKAYNRVYTPGTSGQYEVSPQADPRDLAALKQYEDLMSRSADIFGEQRQAGFGERVSSLGDKLSGNTYYNEVLAQKDVADEIAANTLRAQQQKDLQAAYLAQAKGPNGKVRTPGGSLKVSDDVVQGVQTIFGKGTKDSRFSPEITTKIAKLANQGWSATQIAAAMGDGYTKADKPLFWFNTPENFDEAQVIKNLQASGEAPRNRLGAEAPTQNTALSNRIVQLENALSGKKAGAPKYKAYEEELNTLNRLLGRAPTPTTGEAVTNGTTIPESKVEPVKPDLATLKNLKAELKDSDLDVYEKGRRLDEVNAALDKYYGEGTIMSNISDGLKSTLTSEFGAQFDPTNPLHTSRLEAIAGVNRGVIEPLRDAVAIPLGEFLRGNKPTSEQKASIKEYISKFLPDIEQASDVEKEALALSITHGGSTDPLATTKEQLQWVKNLFK